MQEREGGGKNNSECLFVGHLQGRLALEVNALLAYGAAAPAVQLMWRLGFLQHLLPMHADYLEARSYPRYFLS